MNVQDRIRQPIQPEDFGVPPEWAERAKAFADFQVAAEREACAYRAGIALLGSDRGLANRVDQAIRARGQA